MIANYPNHSPNQPANQQISTPACWAQTETLLSEEEIPGSHYSLAGVSAGHHGGFLDWCEKTKSQWPINWSNLSWYNIVPQRRGAWKTACCSELQQLHTQCSFKLADSERRKQRKIKPCSLTSIGKTAERKKQQPGNHCYRWSIRLLVRCWWWGRIASWDIKSVQSWETSFPSQHFLTECDWVFLFLSSFLS